MVPANRIDEAREAADAFDGANDSVPPKPLAT
jgi:hypothetical protein